MYKLLFTFGITFALLIFGATSFAQISISDRDTTYNRLSFALQHADRVLRLNIPDSEAKHITEDILKLKNLKVLKIFTDSLHSLPEYIYKLKNLEELWIGVYSRRPFFRRNDSLRISPKIINLTKLRSLTLYSQGILYLPDELASCSSLQELTIRYSPLKEAQLHVIVSMKQLKVLALGNCLLKTLPAEFSALEDLEEFYLDHYPQADFSYRNEFKEFPPVLFTLKNLRILNPGDTRITAIPEGIAALKKLQRLDLWNNMLTEIPPVIGELSNLEKLNVSKISRHDNPDTLKISDEIGKLKKLSSLDLSGQGISKKRYEELRKLLPSWQCTITLGYEDIPDGIPMPDPFRR